MRTPYTLKQVLVHPEPIDEVTVVEGGNRLITLSNQSIATWPDETGSVPANQIELSCERFCVDQTGQRYATFSKGLLTVHEINGTERHRVEIAPDILIEEMSFLDSSAQLVFVDKKHRLWHWNRNEIEAFDLPSMPDELRRVIVSPKGRFMATIGKSHVLLWNVDSRKQIAKLPHAARYPRPRFSDDGRYFSVQDEINQQGATLHVASMEDGKTFQLQCRNRIHGVRFWNNECITVDQTHRITRWMRRNDRWTPKVIKKLNSPAIALDLDRTRDRLVAVEKSGLTHVLDYTTGTTTMVIRSPSAPTSISCRENNGNIVLSCKNTLAIWQPTQWNRVRELSNQPMSYPSDRPLFARHRVLLKTAPRLAAFVDLRTGQMQGTHLEHPSAITQLVASADRKHVFIGGEDGQLFHWNLLQPDKPIAQRSFPGKILKLDVLDQGDELAVQLDNDTLQFVRQADLQDTLAPVSITSEFDKLKLVQNRERFPSPKFFTRFPFRAHELRSGKLVKRFETLICNGMLMSSDESELVIATGTGNLVRRNSMDLSLIETVEAHQAPDQRNSANAGEWLFGFRLGR